MFETALFLSSQWHIKESLSETLETLLLLLSINRNVPYLFLYRILRHFGSLTLSILGKNNSADDILIYFSEVKVTHIFSQRSRSHIYFSPKLLKFYINMLMLLKNYSFWMSVDCILCHRGVQLILAYRWTRPAILVVGKGRGGMFLVLLFLPFHSCSSFFPVPLFHFLYCLFYLFSPFLWEMTQNDPQGLTCH